MTPEAWLTVGILAATFAALLGTKLPPVTVFLGALTLCVTFRLAPLERSLAGFANSGVLTVQLDRAGIPLKILVGVVTVILAPMVFGF